MRVAGALALIGAAVVGLAAPPSPGRDPLRGRLALPVRLNETMPDQLLVRFRPDVAKRSPSALAAIAPALGKAKMLARVGPSGWTLWRMPMGTDLSGVLRKINGTGRQVSAQKVNRVYPLLGTPNDGDWGQLETDPSLYLIFEGTPAYFMRLWHLDDTSAFLGWSIWPNIWYTSATKPASATRIAFVDTGCDMGHPDFINAGGSTSDITGGGQLDHSHSAQFHLGAVDPAGTPEDAHGHGTHVIGLAVAAGNNGSFDSHGVIGTGYPSTGWVLRVFDDNGVGTDADAAAAIYYAADNGADIVSLSIGTTNYSQLFQDAVTYAFQKGCLVVAAGNENGNGGGNLGPIYPAACSGALAVTANGPNWIPADSTYAGYGPYVDIAAPGGDVVTDASLNSTIQFIWSTAMRTSGTLNQNPVLFPPYTLNYAYLAGTSMATPIVSGAASLYYGLHGWHQTDGWVNNATVRALEKSALPTNGAPYGGWEYTQGYGSLDVQALLSDADSRGSQVGAIKGIVYFNATPVANVAVKAKQGGGITYSTTTLADGTYRFEALPPGVYAVTTAPFGGLKTKDQLVKAGSDAIGTDFWCGTFFWDTTPPTVFRFDINGTPTTTSVSVRHWAFDTDTGIDSMKMRIGTSTGASDVLADTEVFVDGNVANLTGLSLSYGVTYFLRGTYVNGAGLTTTVDRTFSVAAPSHPVSGTVVLQDFLGATTTVPVTIEIRNPGSTTPLESHVVNLDVSGNYSFNTTLVGTFDIAAKASHWLRKRTQGVVIATGGLSGLAFSLINGDVTGDNNINLLDLNAISAAWRSTSGSANWNPNADLNGDGTVNLADWNIVSKNWRKTGDP